uniref:Uncharacterized protein n=1 Tax=Cacopsylla melanoneura TaxID=428564 RepID=A0A8D8PTP9_9HEMI
MEGEAVHLNNQFNGSGEDKQYESVNTPNVTIDEKMDEDKDFNEDIIKNIAVEKELSEIASAYNLHRNENAAEEMDTGPAQESLDFQNDKVLEPAQQSSETIGWDSPDLSSEITETSTNPNHSDKSKEPTATVADQSENHQDETSADTEDAKQDIEQKNNPEETNNSEDISRDMEDASKDSQENSHKDMEEKIK